MAEYQNLLDQITNLQLENSYLVETIQNERAELKKLKDKYDWAIFNSNQADILVTNTNKNIEVRNKLISDLNAEIEKLSGKLNTSTQMVIDLTNQNIDLLNKFNKPNS